MINANPVATKTTREQRLNIRTSAQQHQLIRQAAEATDSNPEWESFRLRIVVVAH